MKNKNKPFAIYNSQLDSSTAGLKELEEIEDQWLAEKANETLKRIQSGEEKIIPWNKIKK